MRLKRNLVLALVLALSGVVLVAVPNDVLAFGGRPLAPSTCKAFRSFDGSSVDVSWTPANKDNASRYVVERRRNDGKWYWAGRAEAPATTMTDATLRSQDSYKFRVYTRTKDGKKSGVRPCELTRRAATGGKTPADTASPTPEPAPQPDTASPDPVEVPSTPAESPAPTPAPAPALPAPQPVSGSGPVAPPACGAYWGNYVNSRIHGGGSNADAKIRAIENVEGQIGRTFDMDHQFYRWDDFVTDHNIENYVKKSVAKGRIPFLSWKPVFRDGTNVSWRAIANGQHDRLIREKAGQVKSIGVPVLVTVDHEADARVGGYERSTAGSGSHIKVDAGSEADYVAAWRHIHKLFEQEGVTNVSWAWIMTRRPFHGDASFADRMYPGDAYVDWVGLDPYNFFHKGTEWVSMESLMVGFTSWVETRGITKPWILGEWGSVEDPNRPGRKGEWYRQTADYFQSEPRLKAVVHFESSPDYNWRFDTSPSAKQAFADVSKRPYLNQQC